MSHSAALATNEVPCSVEGCGRAARKRGLCSGHERQVDRGGHASGVLRPYGRTPKQVLTDAALAYADADPEDDAAWEAAWHRLRMAARAYVLSPKPTDPRGLKIVASGSDCGA